MNIQKIIDIAGQEMSERGFLEKQEIQNILHYIQYSCIFILGGSNQLSYFKEGENIFQENCTTSGAEKEFSCKQKSNGTPLGAHKIEQLFGENEKLFQSFKQRKISGIIKESDYGEINRVICTRIIQMDGCEKDFNNSTIQRGVYIHGTPNTWYWESDTLKRTHGCISLPPQKMLELFDLVKERQKNTIIYITNKKEGGIMSS